MSTAQSIAAALLFAVPSTLALAGGPAAEEAAREVRSAEQALETQLGIEASELAGMRYAVEHFFVLGGEAADLTRAARSAVDADCRDHCLIFVVEALNMTLRAEIPTVAADDMVAQALFAMVARREASPRLWTDVEQGAWMWVLVEARVQRALGDRLDPS